jgi:hypothetical protein
MIDVVGRQKTKKGQGVVYQRFRHPKIDKVLQQQIIVNVQEQEG